MKLPGRVVEDFLLGSTRKAEVEGMRTLVMSGHPGGVFKGRIPRSVLGASGSLGRTTHSVAALGGRTDASMAARKYRSVTNRMASQARIARGPKVGFRGIAPPGRSKWDLAKRGRDAAQWVKNNPGKTAAGVGVGVAALSMTNRSGRATDKSAGHPRGMYGY